MIGAETTLVSFGIVRADLSVHMLSNGRAFKALHGGHAQSKISEVRF